VIFNAIREYFAANPDSDTAHVRVVLYDDSSLQDFASTFEETFEA